MTRTPRRTLRIPDAEWDAGHAKAQSQGETLTDVLRRLLAGCTRRSTGTWRSRTVSPYKASARRVI